MIYTASGKNQTDTMSVIAQQVGELLNHTDSPLEVWTLTYCIGCPIGWGKTCAGWVVG
jgi:hypothetical protein